MANRFGAGVRAVMGHTPRIRNETVQAAPSVAAASIYPAMSFDGGESGAMKLSSVNRCVEVLSDSIAKLPIYVMDKNTRQHVPDHPLIPLLNDRPNAVQTAFLARKCVEASRLNGGNGYKWILRDSRSMRPAELIPVGYSSVQPFLSTDGSLWYNVRHPFTGEMHTVHSSDMIHVRGYSHNGYTGISVLQRASETISTARAAQSYSKTYYLNGGQPSGVLKTDEALTGEVEVALPDGSKTKVSHREIIRAEWERVHSGPANGQRIAILDKGLNYTPIAVSNRDAQFVEQTDLSVQDIARFFGVPLYKLQSGKQSYSSNEQNAIEYVVSTLHPIVEQYEEELSYKLLMPAEFEKGLRVKMNMMAELRGDVTARGTWYRNMRDVGAYSADDIRALEDLPELGHDKGGDIYYGNKNFAPLDEFRSISGGNGGE